jgi:small nuclear ribonucleoprotein (snRNP)-like protein
MEEISTFVGKKVNVSTTDGRNIVGELLGINESLSIVIGRIQGRSDVPKMILNGEYIKEIYLLEKPFDLRLLAEKISRFFPGMVRLREDIGAIIVMDKIKVTESGVVEGTGPSAERVKAIYEEYIRELSRERAEA